MDSGLDRRDGRGSEGDAERKQGCRTGKKRMRGMRDMCCPELRERERLKESH